MLSGVKKTKSMSSNGKNNIGKITPSKLSNTRNNTVNKTKNKLSNKQRKNTIVSVEVSTPTQTNQVT